MPSRLRRPGLARAAAAPGRKERIGYREALDEAAFARFARLRAWRKLVADRDGVPPYAVFTNEQLAEIVRPPVQTLAALAEIEGVGAARVDKYGSAVLEVLQTEARAAAAPPVADPET
jgi:superfamily II DNA helicase RecQ